MKERGRREAPAIDENLIGLIAHPAHREEGRDVDADQRPADDRPAILVEWVLVPERQDHVSSAGDHSFGAEGAILIAVALARLAMQLIATVVARDADRPAHTILDMARHAAARSGIIGMRAAT